MSFTKRMTVLALDPGPKFTGFAILDVMHAPGVRVTHLEGGQIESSFAAFMSATERASRHNAGNDFRIGVAIESPAGYAFNPSRVPMLLATSARAGGMAWTAEMMGLRVVIATAQQVRKVLCGKANADDATVDAVVRGHVFGAPAGGSDHVKDAIAMGVVGAWMLVGQVVLPEVSDGTRKKKKDRPANARAKQ